MFVTGLLMVDMAWPLTTRWIQEAMAMWGVGITDLVIFLVVLRRQIRLLEAEGPATAARTIEFHCLDVAWVGGSASS
jgi:hypothetical protein